MEKELKKQLVLIPGCTIRPCFEPWGGQCDYPTAQHFTIMRSKRGDWVSHQIKDTCECDLDELEE